MEEEVIFEEAGQMEEPLEKTDRKVGQGVSESDIVQEHHPIKRLEQGKFKGHLAAVIPNVGAVVFGTSEQVYAERELMYAQMYPDDYAKYFPKHTEEIVGDVSKLEEKVSEEVVQEQIARINSALARGRAENEACLLSEALGEGSEDEGSEYEGKENVLCARHSRKGFVLGKEERFCGACGFDFSHNIKVASEGGTGVREMTYSQSAQFDAETGRQLGVVGKLEEMAKTTGSVGSVVLGDVGDALEKIPRTAAKIPGTVAQIGIKAMYPVLGNLAGGLQERIEKIVGKKYYNAGHATCVSVLTNGLAYTIGLPILAVSNSGDPGDGAVVFALAFAYSMIEGSARNSVEPVASLPGKIVSLPIEAGFWGFEKMRNYVRSVRERAMNGS